jgi:hypothetical protein
LRLGPPQIPRAMASEVTGRRLTTLAISRPQRCYSDFSCHGSSPLTLCHLDTHNLRLCLSQYVSNCGENYRIRNFSKKQYNVPGFMVRAGTTSHLRGYSASFLIVVVKASVHFSKPKS